MSALRHFAEARRDAQLTIHETESRDAIKYGKRTVAYVAIGADLWGHLLVERFNTHVELVEALRAARAWSDGACPLFDEGCLAAVALAKVGVQP